MASSTFGVRQRLDDAQLLIQHDRSFGALLMLLLAIAGLSRIQFPEWRRRQPGYKPDKDAFVDYLTMAKQHHLHGFPSQEQFDGKNLPLEEFLYRFLRCPLVHEGDIPDGLQPIHHNHLFSVPAHYESSGASQDQHGVAWRSMPVGYGHQLLERLTRIVEEGCTAIENPTQSEN